MEVFYTAIFAAMAAVAAGLELTRSKDVASESGSREFLRFRNNYVTVYALMMGAPAGPRRSCSLLVALHAGCLRASDLAARVAPNLGSRARGACVRAHSRARAPRCKRAHADLSVRAQRATGCRARMCTRSTSTTALTAGTSAACS